MVDPVKLLQTYGDITSAAKVAGCSRATFRRHLSNGSSIELKQSKKEKQRTVLFLSDVHAPYHDPDAISLMKDYIDSEVGLVTDVVLGGDFCDCFEVSSWNRTPEMFFDKELEQCITLLEDFKSMFPLADFTYLEGNHEDRYNRYLQSKAQELSRIESLKFKNLLELDSLGITYIDNKESLKSTGKPFQIGHLYYLHGHEISAGGSVHICRNKFLSVQQNIIFGHHHQVQSMYYKQMHELKGSWSVGCLCNTNPGYHSLGNQHMQGFAVVRYEEDGMNFSVDNKILIEGKVK